MPAELDFELREDTLMICEMCKKEFNSDECASACSRCSPNKNCHGTRCPYCFYEMIPEPLWIQKIFFWKKRVKPQEQLGSAKDLKQSVSLDVFDERREGEIVGIDTSDPTRLQRILTLGALPGTRFRLIRKFPSFLIEIGWSRFAMDLEIAKSIYVHKLRKESS